MVLEESVCHVVFGRSKTWATAEGHSWAFSTNQHRLPLLGLWFWPGKLYPSPPWPCRYLVNSCSASRAQLLSSGYRLSPFLGCTYHTGVYLHVCDVFLLLCFSILFFSFFLTSFSPTCLLASFPPSPSFFPSLFPFLSLIYKHKKTGSCLHRVCCIWETINIGCLVSVLCEVEGPTCGSNRLESRF